MMLLLFDLLLNLAGVVDDFTKLERHVNSTESPMDHHRLFNHAVVII